MRYTRKDYENFLNIELETQVKEFEQVIRTQALVLKEMGEVFVGRFIKLQPNGIAIFKVRNSDNMPRKNSFWTASFLIGDMGSFKNWGDNSWAELRRSYQKLNSDALCAWIQKSDESNFCIIGIKNLTTDFAQLLEEGKTIIAFGPKDPPLQYLMNLMDIVKDTSNPDTKLILDYEERFGVWNPNKIDSATELSPIIVEKLKSDNCVIIQGPPGTGKTYRMAKLSADLLNENKSVLVIALTNQALMELAKKDNIKPYLEKGKVSKTSLTVDESKELPHLLSIKDNMCNPSKGYLSLATFYISSCWAKEIFEKPFDYVIMDEASQALLPMIAAAMKLGDKIVLIGDQNQLPPIVITNEDIINKYQWVPMVKGFETVCRNFSFSTLMLSDTFRLTKRGAESTGVFYNNELRSVSETQEVPIVIDVLNKKGGPVFVGLDLKYGDKAPINAFQSILNCVEKIYKEDPKSEIAILSKFRESVRQLQKFFVIKWKVTKELPDTIRIETVDRVQGLTVDYGFFFIPNASINYSLEKELFNVATSRARYNTIIVADDTLLKGPMPEEVRKYLLKAQEDKYASFSPQTLSAGNISVKITDRIDLSKFEKKRREIVEGKENIYIIDTNVFVNCPNIISRIGPKYKVIVPAKVLEELDKLKLNAEIDKKNLNEAAKNLNEAFVKHYSRMEEADISLLPKGFDRRNPDCMILSVALKYKEENPILLTSDNMLQSRASGLGITTISLKDFLNQLR